MVNSKQPKQVENVLSNNQSVQTEIVSHLKHNNLIFSEVDKKTEEKKEENIISQKCE